MPKKKKRLWAIALCLLLAIATVLPAFAASAASATTTTTTVKKATSSSTSATTSSAVKSKFKITGRVDVSFDHKTGVLSADYKEGNVDEVTYSWVSGSGSASTSSRAASLSSSGSGTGRLYSVPSAGVYQCIVSPADTTKATGTIASLEVKIFSVTADSFITLNSPKGLYKPGDRVRAKVKTDGVVAKNWSSNVDGLMLPASGNTAVFNMPAANVTLTCKAPTLHTIQMIGGVASTYSAAEGTIVTVRASRYAGKTFDKWVPSGCTLLDATKEGTSFTMPDADVIIEAAFKDPEVKKAEIGLDSSVSSGAVDVSSYASTDTFTDPSRVKYTVTQTNNYKVRMYHAKLGPNYDKFFKLAAGKDTLVTNYFTIIINDNKDIAAIPGPVTIQLTLPRDIQKTDRTFRMVCITKDGKSYSFADQDDDDSTVTFTPDRFFAFALCYNDWQAAYERKKKAEEEAAAQKAAAEAAAKATQEQLDAAKEEGYQQGLAEAQQAQADAEAAAAEAAADEETTEEAPLITSEIRPASMSEITTLTSDGAVSEDESSSADENYSPSSSQGLTTEGGTAMPAAKPPVVEL